MTTSAREMHRRRIGLVTCSQLALFMMTIIIDIVLNVCCIQLTVQQSSQQTRSLSQCCNSIPVNKVEL